MPDHVIFVTTELQERGLLQIEMMLHKQNRTIKCLSRACLSLAIAMALMLQRQIDISKKKKNE